MPVHGLPSEAADGVTDSARERFQYSHRPPFPAGEHLVVIRPYDRRRQRRLAK